MNRDPLTPLTDADVEAYRRDGVVCLRGVFDPEWIALAAAGAERNLAEPGPYAHTYAKDDAGHTFFNDVVSWRRIPEYEQFLTRSPTGQIAARLMGSETARVFYDSMFYRTAGTRARTPWHQDKPYWSVEGQHVCSLWVPLDPVPRESALEFVRGTHAGDIIYYRDSFFADGQGTHAFESAPGARDEREIRRERIPDIDAEPGKYEILAWAMKPGDCLAFNGMVLHGGSGNLPPGKRLRVLAARYTGDDAVYQPDKPGGTDPSLRHAGLEPGQRFQGPHFPQVWPRATG